jgi:dihydropyrimidinase
MTSKVYDCVIRGGRVVTAVDDFPADIAIGGGIIRAIGEGLGRGEIEIDARDRLILPGGVDSHCHIEQLSAAGIMNADTFASATASAAFGGTTTVIPFAAQHVGMRLRTVVDDYMTLAKRDAVVDYTFHMIVADPTAETLHEDIPALVREGHSSIKLFMTYDRLKVDDEQLLDVLLAARKAGALVCVHAENHGMIAWMSRRLIEAGQTAPKFHALSHPRGSEAEAINRLIACAELLDQPIMVFHVSTAEGVAVIRAARARGVKVFAETCPQYLFLTAQDLDKPGTEGAKWMCSPPPREVSDQEALWQALALGDLQVVSSDHAPYAFDATGKLNAGPNPTFKQIANGVPGLEARMPLLFDAMVSKGRLGLHKFVELAATAPAKIYNLHPRKGSIAIGADADLVLWKPDAEVQLSDIMMHDRTGYTPYAGRRVKGWPVSVLRRGEIIVESGSLKAASGSGQFLPRSGGEAAVPALRNIAHPARASV